jgi:hypothetical protein
MPGVVIKKFLGIAPRLSPELLPDTVAQFAFNIKTYSGDLIPYNQSSELSTLAKAGTIKTIYPMDDGAGGYKWLHWTVDVDIAKAQVMNDTTQRVYYTGDGEPRVTNYDLATTGGGEEYPIAHYTLGLPTPIDAITAAATGFATVNTASRSRDSGNIATIITSTPHLLHTGMYVTITGMSDSTFNLASVLVTVINSTTFTYYSNGASSVTPVATSTRSRTSNVATIVTGSAHGLTTGQTATISGMTDSSFNAVGVTVTVTNSTTFTYANTGGNVASGSDTGGLVTPLGTTPDTGGRVNIAGTTLPRTYVYTWYTAWGEESTPSPVSNTVYVKEGQTVELSGLPSAWPGSYTGDYQTADMQVRIYRTVASTAGTLYYKVGEVDLGVTTFTDDVDVSTLTTALTSQYYDQPEPTMQGIKAIHNGMMVGFFGNTLCFAEPGQFHAWPQRYQTQLDANIVAIGNFGTSIIVATDKNPWLIQGTTPASMAKVRMDYVLPCTSKRSMVNMGYGLAYASPRGLAIYASQSGGGALTQYVHDWDTWREAVDYDNLLGVYYNDKYFGQHPEGAFIFQKDEQVGGYLVQISQRFTAAYYNSTDARLYFATTEGGENKVYLWDDPAEPLSQVDWKSKVIVTKDYLNLGAARVVADYNATADDIAVAEQNSLIIATNNAMIEDVNDGGSIGGGAPELFAIGDSFIQQPLPSTATIQFQLFSDKELIFTTELADSSIFRLPTGYRTDTYEVRVTGSKRIRAIHLGETPLGLETA